MLKINRKGWIAVVEVSIAIVVLFAFLLFTFNQENKKEANIFTDLNKAILFQAEENNTFRSFVFSGQTVDIENNLKEFLKKFDARINLTACVIEMTGQCSVVVPDDKDIISYDIFIATDQNTKTYEPRKLRIFVWEE